jgi:hypothetical protein
MHLTSDIKFKKLVAIGDRWTRKVLYRPQSAILTLEWEEEI